MSHPDPADDAAGSTHPDAARVPAPVPGGDPPGSHDISDPSTHVVPPCYITSEVPPVGGVIKQRPEDFFVEEIPLYAPSGEGEHAYLFVEKRGLSTFELLNLLARHFDVPKVALGYAGLKDKAAVTRQVVSIHLPGRDFSEFPELRHDRVTVLWADRHINKLRTGHLAGNRFSIRIRGVPPTAVLSARRVLQKLAVTGVPNRFGEQRFGHLDNNHLIGRAMILGDFETALTLLLGPSPDHPTAQPAAREAFSDKRYADALHLMPRHLAAESAALRQLARGRAPRRAFFGIDEQARRFFLTAFQSAVFNAVLDQRLLAGTCSSLLPGDLAFKHDNRAVFAVDDDTARSIDTADRLGRFEISPSGPMWAAGMTRAAGPVDAMEVQALERLGVRVQDLHTFDERYGELLDGSRRPLRIPLIDPDTEGGADEHGPYVRVTFELPRGSFATVVLREIMKPATGSVLGPEE
ncbi:MAG: tRNA pseudouridine synthase D [Phycisphaerales bacterium]|nr:tRNA pseudouridine synthase D [Phycisphaerales bacterium]